MKMPHKILIDDVRGRLQLVYIILQTLQIMCNHLILPTVTWRQNTAKHTTVNPHRDAENYCIAVKNRAINLKSVTIKWNGQLTKLFSEKNKN